MNYAISGDGREQIDLQSRPEPLTERWGFHTVPTGIGRIKARLSAHRMRVTGRQGDHGPAAMRLLNETPERRCHGVAEPFAQHPNPGLSRKGGQCGPSAPGVPIGCRSPRKRGPYSMPIHTQVTAAILNDATANKAMTIAEARSWLRSAPLEAYELSPPSSRRSSG